MATVLVVDDEKELREATQEILEYGGYKVLEAANGMEGLDVACKQIPDIILADIIMPQMDGYGLVEALQENPETATIPVILLTALSESQAMRQGMLLGADDYLVKPVMPEDLYNAIDVRLRKKERIIEKHDTHLDALRKNIIYALPHEMRTPLHLIMGFANMLELNHEEADPAEIQQSASAIFEAGQRLERITENYLVYAQLEVIAADLEEQEKLRNNTAPDAHEFIELAAVQQAQIRERIDDLSLDLQPATLGIADNSLTKIITELIDNALKFSEAGTPIQVSSTQSDGQYVISIADQGRGMDAQQIEQIGAYMQFERAFYEQPGLGLGLAIAKRLIELHGGQMAVESSKDQGTQIRVSFPI